MYQVFSQTVCGPEIEGMACIPSGFFIRGSNHYDQDERPESKLFVSSFYMDLTEVTNEDFQKCIQVGKCQDCLEKKKCDYIGPKYGEPYLKPKQPVLGVSWYTANEYCEFVGKRLPTEAEWEKAARGPEGSLYPWGDQKATCENSVIEENSKKGCGVEKNLPTANVKSRSPGVYGLFDMAGNSWEWVSDWYSESYGHCGEFCQKDNPKGPCDGKQICPGFTKKVIRGGSWWWDYRYARGSKRRAHEPENFPLYHHFGFRCAKDALQIEIPTETSDEKK